MSLVNVEILNSVATLTLNDPGRRNAVTLEMCNEVSEAMDAIEANPAVHSVIVTGAAPAFCAGADLSHLGSSEEEGLMAIYEGFLRIGRCPLPTIAAVNGAAVGAGMNLALICDVRMAGRSARFDDRFLQIGIHPGGGHTWMMHNIVGPQASAAAILFSEVLDGPEAARVGLAHRCVEDDELLATCQAMAERAGKAPRDLIITTKQTMATMRTVTSQDDAVQIELVPQAASARTPEFKKMLAALKAKIKS